MERRIEQLEKEVKELKEIVHRLINSYLGHDDLMGEHFEIRKYNIIGDSTIFKIDTKKGR